MIIRPAQESDLPEIVEIINFYVRTSTALWSMTPTNIEARRLWLRERLQGGFPVIVCADKKTGKIQGYGTYGPFRAFDGYRHTVEHSLYILPDTQGKGLGKTLLRQLMDHAAQNRVHVMIGAITADNWASIALHTHAGFQKAALLPEVGTKFGQWLDLLFMYKVILAPEGGNSAHIC